jgi:hypothetical protein
MRVAGVHVAAGSLYLAIADATEVEGRYAQKVDSRIRRLQPSPHLAGGERIADLLGRVKQEVRALPVDRACYVATRRYSGWKYSDASERVTMINAAQLACHELGLSFDEIKTEQIARVVKVPAKQLELVDAVSFGFDKAPPYWLAGLAVAYAGCAALLQAGA